ncbi:metallophosphoesterase family protein [Cellulosilyticum ruminicola]|uniref:metallophosphoesterase family protein n=1 Tax=Cellulosilyticum ruminicola TaxID=425254 RepID=UPI00241ED0F8|nr:metallophosphoesterase family protein [Cellulosilyticum ruminicola]
MIYGHSHQYAAYKEEYIQYINPGSCGRKRFNLPLSFVSLDIEEGKMKITK